MRRIIVLTALLGLMKFLDSQVSGDLGPEALVLASIGFVVLASFTVAEAGAALGLPRVTGYIVSGIVLGPFASNILANHVVADMKMFNTLALGLIATGAGLELDVKQLGKVIKTLLVTIGFKILLCFALVGGGIVTLIRLTNFPQVDTPAHVWAFAGVIAALTLGTSPAITLAVMNETKAKGRLMDITLGAAILKDLVVVVCLGIAVAAAKPIAGVAGGGEHSLVMDLLHELGGAIVAGGLLGVLLILYMRFVRAEMLLFVAAMILVTAEVGHALHLEILLIYIAAGFVVKNFSRYGHDLLHPVETVSLPVFIVFFTIAGASINLKSTLTFLPFALAICVIRAIAYIISSRVGGAIGKESDVIKKNAWLAYIPQAGVTLGLVGLAAEALPGLKGPIANTGMAMVAINLLIGPLLQRKALSLAGEIPELAADENTKATSPSSSSLEQDELDQEIQALSSKLPAKLSASYLSLYETIKERLEQYIHFQLAPAGADMKLALARSFDAADRYDQLKLVLGAYNFNRVAAGPERSRAIFRSLREAIRALPEQELVPLEAHLLVSQPDDSRKLRRAKRSRRLATWFSSKASKRQIPMQRCARAALEARFADLAFQDCSGLSRGAARILEEISRAIQGKSGWEEAHQASIEAVDSWIATLGSDARIFLAHGFRELARLWNEVDSPLLPAKELDVSKIDERVRLSMKQIDDEPQQWIRLLESRSAAICLEIDLQLRRQAIEVELEEELVRRAQVFVHDTRLRFRPIESALSRFTRESSPELLNPNNEKVDNSNSENKTPELLSAEETKRTEKKAAVLTIQESDAIRAEVKNLIDTSWRELLGAEEREHILTRAGRLSSSSLFHRITVEMRAGLERLPETFELVQSTIPLHKLARPEDGLLRQVRPRERAAEILLERLLPQLEERMEALSLNLGASLESLFEAFDVILHAFDDKNDSLNIELIKRELERIRAELEAMSQTVVNDLADCNQDVQHSFTELSRTLTERKPEIRRDLTIALSTRLFARLGDARRNITEAFNHWLEESKSSIRRLLSVEMAQGALQRYSGKSTSALDFADAAQAWTQTPNLSTNTERLLRLTPLKEVRMFTARQTELKRLVDLERRWLKGSAGSSLIVGAPGSGKSSLLHIAQLEFGAPRIIKLEPFGHQRKGALLRALALELDCKPKRLVVRKELCSIRTTVIMDDIEQWLANDSSGTGDLESFLDVIAETNQSVCWIASISSEGYSLLSEVLNLDASFASKLELEALSSTELAESIESRMRLGAINLHYQSNRATRLIGLLRRGDERKLYYDVLARVSGGNLSRAIAIFRRSLQFSDTTNANLHPEHALAWGLPTLHHLPPRELAILRELLTFRWRTPDEISKAMHIGPNEAQRYLHHLCAAGLVVRTNIRHKEYDLVPNLRPLVAMSLRKIGVLP